jgi:hypothetical protein
MLRSKTSALQLGDTPRIFHRNWFSQSLFNRMILKIIVGNRILEQEKIRGKKRITELSLKFDGTGRET